MKRKKRSLKKSKRSEGSEQGTLFWVLNKADKTKDYRLRLRYGIDIDDYNRMLEEQDGSCAICGKLNSDTKHGLVVDHNHKTGRVRGLLCTYCNRRVVGRVGDDRKRMEGFMNYIKKQLREDKEWV